ncbi:MAG: helix-turn-helix domain-containing protein [Lactobacillaceae bacterium]|jgi:transcriptional regulator with XRE-family HTH domain|nr:helix-turn-helix domain-containing protein [Lactobacillaceae bacterium]
MDKLKLIGKNIKALRQEQNLTQDQFAEILHVTRQSVSKWETGDSAPDIENLIFIAEKFGVSMDDLVFGIGHRNTSNNKTSALEYLDRKNQREENRKILNRPKQITNVWEFLAEYWWVVTAIIGTIGWAVAIAH